MGGEGGDGTYFPIAHVHPHGCRWEGDVEDCMVQAVEGVFFLFGEEEN